MGRRPPPAAERAYGARMATLLRALVGGLLLAAGRPAHAHEPMAGVLEALTTREGLPINWVSSFLQDDDGGLWIGTDSGLVWYDGVTLEVVPETRGAHIVQLVEGADGQRWVFAEARQWRLEGGALVAADLPRTSRSVAVHQGQDGALWASDGGGLLRLGRPGPRVPAPPGCGGLHLPHGRALECTEGGLPLELDDGALRVVRDVTGAPLPAAPLLHDSRGVAWVATPGQVRRYIREPRGMREIPPLPALAFDVEAAHEAASGEVWLATADHRVGIWDGVGLREHAQLDHRVRAFFEDREGSLWAATRGHGALRLTAPQRFSLLAGAHEGDTVWTSLATPDGTVWLGTDTGLMRVAPGGGAGATPVAGGPDGAIYALALDARGGLLVGGPGGLARWDGEALTEIAADPPGPNIRGGILEDHGGRIWAGGRLALWRSEGPGRPLAPVPLPVSLEGPYPPVGAIAEDATGRVWVATNAGLLRWSADGASVDVLDVGHVRGLTLRPDGTAWASRAGGGLVRVRGDTIDPIEPARGAPEATAHAVTFDDHGAVWLPTNRGVFRAAARQLEAVADHTDPLLLVRGFGESDGLPSLECNSGHPAARVDARGRLHVATMRGPAALDADPLAVSGPPPVPRLRRLEVDAAAVDLGGPTTLAPGTRTVAIHYTAPDLRDPEGLRFRYRLDGHDDGWVEAGDRRMALWTGLPAGDYTFRLQVRPADGPASPIEATLPFTIEARLVDQLWFRLLLALGGLSLAGVLVRAHLHRARERELTGLIEARTAELRAARDARAAQAELLAAQAAALEAQARELADIDERKSAFFANVSHELRTPLTLIQGPVAAALSAGVAPGPADLARIARNARRLEDRITELLDIARLDAGRLPLAAREADLRARLAARVEGFADHAAERGVALELGGDPVLAWFDPRRLDEIVDNLVANAVRHTDPGGAVHVGVSTEAQAAVVTVADTGSGIPAAHLPHVFDRFFQAPGSPAGSAGLGLALSRALARRHGGDLEASSAVGRGTTFTLRLPLGRAHLSDDDIADPTAPDPLSSPPAAPLSLPPTPAPQPAHPETILLVEDDPDLRGWLRQVLGTRYTVQEASDGAAALARVRDAPPDLVLTDAMMPGMDGLALCDALRADPDTRHLPVIMLSARAGAARRVEGLDHGVDAYLTKPVHPDELLLQVRNVLAARARLRARHRKQLVLADDSPALPSADERLLAQVREAIHAHMADPDFGVVELADAMHMSRRQLGRRLSALTGSPPSVLLRAVRLERARTLLEQDAGTIAEIGYAVGFRRPARFSEQFREAFGRSPTEHKRQAGPDDAG